MSSSIIHGVRAYMLDCPLIPEFARINIDYLGDKATDYTIEAEPAEPIIQRYINGDTKRQFVFMLASKECYGPDVLQNMENSGFYERLADWLDEQDLLGNFPELPEGKEAMRIRAVTHGYAFQADDNEARYQIKCVLEYYNKGA